jgi:hypothetical protein
MSRVPKGKKEEKIIFLKKEREIAFAERRVESDVRVFFRARNPTRVDRFFLVQHIKTWENIPNYHKIDRISIK